MIKSSIISQIILVNVGSVPTPRTTEQPTGLVEFEEFLRTRLTARNANLAEATIQTRLRAVKMLMKRVNLWDSEEARALTVVIKLGLMS